MATFNGQGGVAADTRKYGPRIFIFSPGGTAEGNVYTDWATLYADVAATSGTKVIVLDDEFVSSVPIPDGVYDLTDCTLTNAGVSNKNANENKTTVTWGTATQLRDVSRWENLWFYAGSSGLGSPIVYTKDRSVTMVGSWFLGQFSSDPIIQSIPAGTKLDLLWELQDSSFGYIPSGGGFAVPSEPVLALAGAGDTIGFKLKGSSLIASDAVLGGASDSITSITVDPGSYFRTSQPGFAGSIPTIPWGAEAVNFDSTGLTNITAFTVDGALRDLDSAIGGGGGGEDLAATLVLGNTTGGTNIAVSNGDALYAEDNGGAPGYDLVIGPGHGTDDGALVMRDATGSLAGNPRGVNAVDLQATRTIGVQVASGDRSFIAGGRNNSASGTHSFSGGYGSQASGATSLAWGVSALATPNYTQVVGHYNSILANVPYGSIFGGRNNTIDGSNANNSYNHYPAIVGGRNNRILNNSYGSFVAAGADNTIGDLTTYYASCAFASGRYNYITSGNAGLGTSGAYYSVAMGNGNQVRGAQSAFALGDSNRVYGNYSLSGGSGSNISSRGTIGWGESCLDELRAVTSAAFGNGTYAYVQGAMVWGAASSSLSNTVVPFPRSGAAQPSGYALGTTTTNATPQRMTTNGSTSELNSATSRNILVLRENIVYTFRAMVSGYQTGGAAGTPGDSAGWVIEGMIKRVGTSTTLVASTGAGSPTFFDAAASGWNVAVAANDANESLIFTVTGEANKNIVWAARIDAVEAGNPQ
jgi:hypothetical protein